MNKEACVVVVDAHSSMNKQFADSTQNRFSLAIDSIKMLLQQKLLYNPSHEVGMVMFGTSDTSNALADKFPGNYKNVSTTRTLAKIDQDFYRQIDNFEAEQAKTGGDIVDGLVTALDMIDRHCGTRKYKKRVFLITDGEHPTTTNKSEIDSLIEKLNEKGIRLNVITLDFANELGGEDDSETDEENQDGSKEAKKARNVIVETPNQQKNKELLVQITESLEQAAIFPAHVAMEIYQHFNKREYMARTKYRGSLDISDDLNLNVQIYSRTREEVFPSLKKYSKVVDENPSLTVGKVALDRQFTEIEDADQQPVPIDQQRKAYLYGKQLVPVSVENEGVLSGKQQKATEIKDDNDDDAAVRPEDIEMGDHERQFKMLGFAKESSVPRHHFVAGVDVILPVKGSKNERAFAAIVTQMIESKKVMIAKIIERKNADPKLVSLYPHISKKLPLLYMVQLPTSEDLRDYQFPPLVASTNAQRQAASDFIDALDLTEGEAQNLDPKRTFNPSLQYFAQVITERISDPQATVPEMNENIQQYMRPNLQMFQNATAEIEEFSKQFKLTQVETKQEKKRVYWKDVIEQEEKKLESMTAEAAAERLKLDKDDKAPDADIKEISSINPIADFKKMITDRKQDLVQVALEQMEKMITRFIDSSMKGDLFDKALECLQAMREGCVKEDEAESFNTLARKLKRNPEFFTKMQAAQCSLITKHESQLSSNVEQAEANEFITTASKMVNGQAKPSLAAKIQNTKLDEID